MKESTQGDQKLKKNKKRGQGEGSIYRRKDGRWAAAVWLGYENGRVKRKTLYGRTREEVKDKLIATLNDVQKGIPIRDDRQTVEQFLLRWLEDSVKPSSRYSTYINYVQRVKQHIIPAMGKVPLSKLTPQQVQSFIRDRLQKGLAPRTVEGFRTTLRRALHQALKWGLVARNVASLADPPRLPKREIKPMTTEQARQFLQACKGDRFEALYSVALALGLRKGEATGLRWKDIDWEARQLYVRKSLQRIEGKLQLVDLKTKSSSRDLPLTDSLIAALKEHRKRQLEQKLLAGKKWQETGLIFTTTIGSPLDGSDLSYFYFKVLERAKLPRFRFHDLRHSCASLLFAQGVPARTVQDILGHSQISITMDIYTHIMPEVRLQAIDLVDSLLTGSK